MLSKNNLIKIRFSGIGGQGIILSGYILGKAAVVYDGILAVQTQSYGPEVRGSKCKSDVILSYDNSPIQYPAIEKADIMVVMAQEAWVNYNKILHEKSIVFIDSDLVQIKSNFHKIYPVSATKNAEQLGNRIIANIVMLGAVVEVTQIVSKSAINHAVIDSVPKNLKELNMKALQNGFNLGKGIINSTH